MTADASNNDSIIAKARALIRPQLDGLSRSFQDALGAIRSESGKPDWKMEREAEKVAGSYARDNVTVVAESIAQTLEANGGRFTKADISYLLTTLMPDLNPLKTFAYQNIQNMGFTTGIGIGIAMDDAHRLATDYYAARIMLFASEGGQQIEGATRPGKAYSLHPSIEGCAGKLFRDGHYKQAALESYICVINALKARTELTTDGDDLVNKAFGFENRTPILQVNDLSTVAERDEQKGFMFLFKGIVGLRNFKAHSNALFDDESRAHEYLAMSSLLMRILELARVNKP